MIDDDDLFHPSSEAPGHVLPSYTPPAPAMVLSPSLEPISLSPDSTSFANFAEHTMDVEQAFPVASGMGQGTTYWSRSPS